MNLLHTKRNVQLAFLNILFVFDLEFTIDLKIVTISSLQCYSILSTIAQVLRKMSLKILASRFWMLYLSQTFESYQRVKMYTYTVNDLGLKEFLQ